MKWCHNFNKDLRPLKYSWHFLPISATFTKNNFQKLHKVNNTCSPKKPTQYDISNSFQLGRESTNTIVYGTFTVRGCWGIRMSPVGVIINGRAKEAPKYGFPVYVCGLGGPSLHVPLWEANGQPLSRSLRNPGCIQMAAGWMDWQNHWYIHRATQDGGKQWCGPCGQREITNVCYQKLWAHSSFIMFIDREDTEW